jgi:hypothetical protein
MAAGLSLQTSRESHISLTKHSASLLAPSRPLRVVSKAGCCNGSQRSRMEREIEQIARESDSGLKRCAAFFVFTRVTGSTLKPG